MRIGRPKAENPMNFNVTVRFDAITFGELEDYCKEEGKTKAEATREGVRLLLESRKPKEGG